MVSKDFQTAGMSPANRPMEEGRGEEGRGLRCVPGPPFLLSPFTYPCKVTPSGQGLQGPPGAHVPAFPGQLPLLLPFELSFFSCHSLLPLVLAMGDTEMSRAWALGHVQARVSICPFPGRHLLCVSPQPGVCWPGRATGKGSPGPPSRSQSLAGHRPLKDHTWVQSGTNSHPVGASSGPGHPGPAQLAACEQGQRGRALALVELLASRAEPWST